MILRLYGKSNIMQFSDPGFAEELTHYPGYTRAGNIVFVDIERVSDS